MLVFIDDSGDAGFKLGRGSSQFFVIALVIFDDDLEAEKTAVAIKELRRILKFSDKVEFKFNGSRSQVRRRFLKVINEFSFKIRCLVIDKGLIKVDGSGDRYFRRNFLTYLRKQLNSEHKKIMKNCRLVDSKGNVLIQMADMVAGSIRRSYDGSKTDAKIYKAIIKKHVQDEWKFK